MSNEILKCVPAVPAVPTRGTVFLVHGLLRCAGSMRTLAERFSYDGFDAWLYDYPSSQLGIFGQGERLAGTLKKAFQNLPAGTPIFFITHSMGGILLRIALTKFSAEEIARVRAIAMLAPPNRGSYWPKIVKYAFPPLWFLNRCLRDLRCSPDSPLFKIALPQTLPPLKIIASKFDCKVARKFLPIEGWNYDLQFVFSSHDMIRFSKAAYEAARDFFAGTLKK